MRISWGGPPNVEKFARKGDVEGLVRALRYEDPIEDRGGRVVDLGATVRAAAAQALARTGSPEATNALVLALSDPLESVRVSAIRGLREHGGEAVAERLMAAVAAWTRPEHAAAREDALDAVIELRHPEVLRLTTGALVLRPADLEDADIGIVSRLAAATSRADVDAGIGDLIGRLREDPHAERARRLLVALAPQSIGPLVEALDDRPTQRGAALALGSIHDSKAVPALSSVLLDSSDDDTRTAAAWALGEIRHPSAVEALLVATGDDHYEVRAAAADSFDKLGNAAIALAMNVLSPPALDNGAGATREALPPTPAPAGGPGAPPATGSPAPPTATGSPAQAAGTPPPALGERARPILRRLFGRDLPAR